MYRILPLLFLLGTTFAQYQASIEGLYIWDIFSKTTVLKVTSGSTIDVQSLENFTIIAQTIPATVGVVFFYIDGTFSHSSGFAPYTLNQKVGGPQTLSMKPGTYNIMAVPFQFNNLTNPGSPGTSLSVTVTLQNKPLDLNTVLGPFLLASNGQGNSVLQMLSTTVVGSFQVNSLEFFLNSAANLNGQYEVRVYQGNGGSAFSLVSKQSFNMDVNVNTIPAIVNVNPPVKINPGQALAIVNLAGPLPFSDVSGTNNYNMYTLNTAPPSNIGSTIVPSLNQTAAGWRARIGPAPPTNPSLSQGAVIAIIVIFGVLIAVGAVVGAFLLWRYRNRSKDSGYSVDISKKNPKKIMSISQPSMLTPTNLETEEQSNRRPTGPMWPPRRSEAFNQSIDVESMSKNPGSIACARCEDKKAVVSCDQCRDHFCRQCIIELHYSEGSKWAGHTIVQYVKNYDESE